MKIIAAQINPIVGDLAGNTERIIQAIHRASSKKADLVVFPELAIVGYPPDDLVLLPHFMEAVSAHLEKIAEAAVGIAVIVGLPRYNLNKREKTLYNSVALIQEQKIIDYADKILLPTYDVFDEKRYFEPGTSAKIWNIGGHKIAITICEDLWEHSGLLASSSYHRDPILEIKEGHPDCLINISASPYSVDKLNTRLQVCMSAAKSLLCPVIFCNQVGGNDSLIFDGYSMYVDARGLLKNAMGFVEDDLEIVLSHPLSPVLLHQDSIEDLYHALVLGVHDYFTKSGFTKCSLGLSGGIDSAVVACIAAEALGKEQVLALSMPSRYSSPESLRDAFSLSKNLGIACHELSIESVFESYLSVLSPSFQGKPTDITEENMQARIRGMLLMAFSNKFGSLVLSTGNKSELALGYCTLYGDMCGGLAVIGDVTKGQVYKLARWINRNHEIIPAYTIERPPSAELKPSQKDSDTLPDYEIIDQVVQAYVEEHRSPEWICERYLYPHLLVDEIIRRIHQNEYKRRQSPPTLRVSEKAFSVGRKFPIVQRWV